MKYRHSCWIEKQRCVLESGIIPLELKCPRSGLTGVTNRLVWWCIKGCGVSSLEVTNYHGSHSTTKLPRCWRASRQSLVVFDSYSHSAPRPQYYSTQRSPQQDLDLWSLQFHEHRGSITCIWTVGRTIWRRLSRSHRHLFLDYCAFRHGTDEACGLRPQGDTAYIFQDVIWISSH